jgi:hypothetical protein
MVSWKEQNSRLICGMVLQMENLESEGSRGKNFKLNKANGQRCNAQDSEWKGLAPARLEVGRLPADPHP